MMDKDKIETAEAWLRELHPAPSEALTRAAQRYKAFYEFYSGELGKAWTPNKAGPTGSILRD